MENIVAVNSDNNVGGALPDAFVFKRSTFFPNNVAIPIRGTNAFGAPGVDRPQSSNVQLSGTQNATAISAARVAQGPFSQSSYINLGMMVAGLIIIALLAHGEVV